jgi:DNA-binding GntR family transcriptional regulator
MRFYEVMFRAAGQGIAWEIVQRLNGRISRLRALTLATKARNVSGQARMARICAAICAGDAEGAAEAVRAHLTEAAEIARLALEAEA